MLLVVFGAGASFDSFATDRPRNRDGLHTAGEMHGGAERQQYRLPLADQLFEPRPAFTQTLRRLDLIGGLTNVLASPSAGRSVENMLDEYAAEIEVDPRRRRHLAAIRYYIADVIRSCEETWTDDEQSVRLNHGTLFDEIEHWRHRSRDDVVVVTFNYDRLIERGLALHGYRVVDLSDYVEGGPYVVVKLHGSTNWGRAVRVHGSPLTTATGKRDYKWLINATESWDVGREFRSVSGSWLGRAVHLDGSAYLVPAIAVPLTAKPEFECPAGHLTALTERLHHVRRILTIGWRGREHAFLKLLRDGLNSPVEMMVVTDSTENSNAVISQLTGAGVEIVKHSVFGGGFSQFLAARDVKTWLAK